MPTMKCDPVFDRFVLVFALKATDVLDAFPATVAYLREQGAILEICLPADEEGIDAFDTGENFTLDQPDDAVVEWLIERLMAARPVCVLLPALDGAYERLAAMVWDAMRRAGLNTLLIGELDLPLAQVTGWQGAAGFVAAPGTARRAALRLFRNEAHGNGTPGNIFWQVDPLHCCFPGQGVGGLKLPATAYRIDVIIRTAGRDTLGRAIDSVLAQSWGNVGLVIVNVGQRALDAWLAGLNLPAHVYTTLVDARGASRSHAANLGLQASSSEAFVFLDDDDIIYPSHFSLLARALDAQPGAVVAYGGVRIEQIDAHGRRSVDLLNEPFDLERLYMENFIPIHACLVRRRIRDAGIRFDETLTHFEDWDFWLRCAEEGAFHHVPEVVGVYFAGDASGVASAEMGAIYERWLSRCGPAPLERIARWALSRKTPGARAIQREAAALEARLQEADGELARLRESQAGLQATVAHLGQERDALSLAQERLGRLGSEVRGLRCELDALYGSTSWQVMAPMRKVVSMLRSGIKPLRMAGQLVRMHGGGPIGVGRLGASFFRAVRHWGFRPALRRGIQLLGLTANGD